MSQNTTLIKAMKARYITGMDALEIAKCFRLPARVYDIEKMGHVIKRRWVSVPSGKNVMSYKIVGKEPFMFDDLKEFL